jgi:hypothetical protein
MATSDALDERARAKQELLALLLAEAGMQAAPPDAPAPRQPGDAIPLSFAQERVLVLDHLRPDDPFYNLRNAVRLIGPLRIAALRHSLNAILRRHEALRTSFATLDARTVPIIAAALQLDLPLLDLRALPLPTHAALIADLARIVSRQPFDLARGPLLRAVLLRLGANEHILLLVMHYVAFDAWAIGVLMRELGAHYDAALLGRPAALPSLAIQYADYALWQRRVLQGARLDELLGYWRRQLAGAPQQLNLPTDHPRPPQQSFCGTRHALSVSRAVTDAVIALSQRAGATLFMAGLATFAILLAQRSGQRDLVIGTPIANRTRSELEDLIGLFVNLLALRIDLSGNPSFDELLARVREVCLSAYTHQDLPFEQLIAALQPQADVRRPPLAQVMFVLQNAPATTLALAGLTAQPLELPSETAKFELRLDLRETPEGLAGYVEYNTGLFSVATIKQLVAEWQSLLALIVGQPDVRVESLMAREGRTADDADGAG